MAFWRALYPAHAQVEQGGGAEEHAAQQKARSGVPHCCSVCVGVKLIKQSEGGLLVMSNLCLGRFKRIKTKGHTDSLENGGDCQTADDVDVWGHSWLLCRSLALVVEHAVQACCVPLPAMSLIHCSYLKHENMSCTQRFNLYFLQPDLNVSICKTNYSIFPSLILKLAV